MTIHLIRPSHNETVEQLTEEQLEFLASHAIGNNVNDANAPEEQTEKIDWLNLYRRGEEQSLPRPIELCWETSEPIPDGAEVCLLLSSREDFSDAKQILCVQSPYHFYNPFIGSNYYWKVAVILNGTSVASSETRCFWVSPQPPRTIAVGGLGNIRDIGGYVTKDGKKVRQGLFYRGCEMEFHLNITEDGRRVLREALKIRTDLDLRVEAVRANLTQSELGEDIAFQLIPCAAYEGFLQEKENAAKLFRLFADRSNYPIYAHCWGGADRTGTLMFILCAILGIREQDLFTDYEFTSLSVWGRRLVTGELFTKFLDELQAYGSETDSLNEKCESFLLSCGITKQEIETIREIFLEP